AAGLNIITLGTVPDGKLWVITSVAVYCTTANPTMVLGKIFDGVDVPIFFGQKGIVADEVYPQVCHIVMKKDDEIRFYWEGCALNDGIESAAFGYQVALY
ncbi:unnamed protein product, partial [marine sediment metagenome]